MNLFGFEVTRRKTALAPVDDRGRYAGGGGGWWGVIREPFAGAWQRNVTWTTDTVAAHHAVYACITRISNSIGKLAVQLKRENAQGIWETTSSASFSPVLKRPNPYQNHIQFKEWWVTSKLMRGNAYALKVRDERNVVVRLYLLDPTCVTVLVSPSGDVFYQLRADNLSDLETDVVVPAREIIHDRMNCLFHPLVGVSPLFAAGLSAMQGLKIQNDAATFFDNGGRPGGVLTAPGAISEPTAVRLKDAWGANYGGANAGKVAVLGDGLTFEPMKMSYVDAQVIDQLKWTADVVCSVFGVPPFKLGLGTLPAGMKIGDLNQVYYEDALHCLIEEMEQCLDDGLALPPEYRTELDLENLLRMDPATAADMQVKLVGGAIATPNEARLKMNYGGPVEGGDSVYLQEQNYSLAALAQRDANDPFASAPAPQLPAPEEEDAAEEARAFLEHIKKGLTHE